MKFCKLQENGVCGAYDHVTGEKLDGHEHDKHCKQFKHHEKMVVLPIEEWIENVVTYCMIPQKKSEDAINRWVAKQNVKYGITIQEDSSSEDIKEINLSAVADSIVGLSQMNGVTESYASDSVSDSWIPQESSPIVGDINSSPVYDSSYTEEECMRVYIFNILTQTCILCGYQLTVQQIMWIAYDITTRYYYSNRNYLYRLTNQDDFALSIEFSPYLLQLGVY
jgi:hypothetical protein